MPSSKRKKTPWKKLVAGRTPLLLPAAHDALTARLIERAGFAAYQVGGFALAGARFGYPDIDLIHYAEIHAGVREIVAASNLPVLVDADDCYGDVKNVARTIRGYEDLGVSALFFEDQAAPKRCGHMEGKKVIPPERFAAKVRAAVGVRNDPNTFLIARTDAREAAGLDDALRRAEMYLKAGADGLFIEGPTSVEELERIGKHFAGTPKVANMLEGGGKTPILTPKELHCLGFAMVMYPTSLIFRVAKALETALAGMLAGKLEDAGPMIDFEAYKEIVDLKGWDHLEEQYGAS